MIRDAIKEKAFWDRWIDHCVYEIGHRKERLDEAFSREDYRPQYTYDLAKTHIKLLLRRYSRGDSVEELSQYVEPFLEYWEKSERLGKEVWTPAQQHSRHTWAVNLDHYIDCFWLVGLALTLKIPDDQWHRLLALVGNEGEDALLDRIIATRQPNRKIGASLCYPKPYARLLEAIDAPKAKQAALLYKFVAYWYEEIKTAAKSGRQKQATPYKEPYWHGHHLIAEGGYFGYWCLEAAAAVKAFGLDDRLCLGHPHYPGDLLRPDTVTPADASRLPAQLVASLNAPEPLPPGTPQQLSNWQAFKLVVKNKLKR